MISAISVAPFRSNSCPHPSTVTRAAQVALDLEFGHAVGHSAELRLFCAVSMILRLEYVANGRTPCLQERSVLLRASHSRTACVWINTVCGLQQRPEVVANLQFDRILFGLEVPHRFSGSSGFSRY